MNLESVSDYIGLQKWLNEYCKEKGHTCWHNYGPADFTRYKKENPRILLINSESVGYDGCENVPPDEYISWIRGRYNTPLHAALLVSVIREYVFALRVGGKSIFERPLFVGFYQNTDLLVHRMEPTIYMNARITSNNTGSFREDRGSVQRDAGEFAAFRKKYIEIMDPEIVILGGKGAHDSLFSKDAAFEAYPRPQKRVSKMDGRILISMPHLSRLGFFGGYQGLHDAAEQAASLYVGEQ